MSMAEFDALQTRIIILENLVLCLLARHPDATSIVGEFEAFSAQQIAMGAAVGAASAQTAGLRQALTELAHAAALKERP